MRECGCSSVVEHLLPKQKVAGSNPVARSKPLRYGNIHNMTSIAHRLEKWIQSRAPDEIRALSRHLLALVADPEWLLNVVVRLTAFCVFVSLLLTHDLWFMEGRLYAPAPMMAGLPAAANIFLYGLILAVCGMLCVFPSQRRWGAVVAPAFVYFVLQDQLRGQFYLYMYVFALLIAAAVPKRVTDKHLDPVRFMLAGVYIWAGVYKLNAIFITQVFPWFVAPFFPFPEAAKVIGFAVPFLEAAVGVLLLLPPWRWLAQILAFGMLVVVLLAIGPLGHNQALPVWPANVYMDALVIFLFIGNRRTLPFKPPLNIAATLLFIVLPALGFLKQMGPHPTFQLYCGCVPLAQVEFAKGEDFTFLPETLATLAAEDGSLEASDITYRLFNVSGCNFSPGNVPYIEGLKGFCPHLKKPGQTKLRVREPQGFTSTTMTETVYDLCEPERTAN